MSGFVTAYPSTTLFERPNKTPLTEVLWGDFGQELAEPRPDGWTNVRVRGREGWIKGRVNGVRLLEVNFVDIGQGDGALVVMPDDRKLVVDAGEGSNMLRYLSWRFNLARSAGDPVRFDAVVTHSDLDHYGGFQGLVDHPRIRFENVFHNGIFERVGDLLFGKTAHVGGRRYLTDLVRDPAAASALLADPAVRGGKRHPKLMASFLERGALPRMVGATPHQGSVFLPGYEPQDGTASIEVLGPVPEVVGGAPALRWLGSSDGEMKNGHSVVLRIDYGAVRVFLGGDLNGPAQDWLLEAWSGRHDVFRAQVAKACHHGSADLHPGFLDAIGPNATVISSGDDEAFCHPRPDAIGVIGRHSRGTRPLVFSTELARSSPEAIVRPSILRNRIMDRVDRLIAVAREGDDAAVDAARSKVTEALAEIRRTVATYGMITLRTDGTRVILATRLEASTAKKRWHVARLEPNAAGELDFVSSRGH